MNLRLTLGVGCGLATAITGGWLALKSGKNISPGGGSDITPGGDTIAKLRPPIRLVPMRIPNGDNSYIEVTEKYGAHFDRKIGEFVSGNGLVIPDENNNEPEIYLAWEGKKDELRKSYKLEFNLDVTNDEYISPDNIETALRMVIFKLCAGEDEARKGKYCMVEEQEIGDEGDTGTPQ